MNFEIKLMRHLENTFCIKCRFYNKEKHDQSLEAGDNGYLLEALENCNHEDPDVCPVMMVAWYEENCPKEISEQFKE